MSKTYLYQINVTRDCNLRCTHCYIHSDVKKNSKEMALDQLISIARQIREHMRKIEYEHAEIHLIGGEPTMLGLKFFEDGIPRMREILAGGGYTSEILLVSNLLSTEIVEIAGLFDRVSTSYEPVTRFPKERLERMWVENVQKLRAAGVDLGVTTAITKPVIEYGGARLLDWFYAQGMKQIHFGFFIPEGDGLVNQLTVFPEFHETSEFLIETAKWYLERREIDPDLWVNPFESMLSAIATDRPLDDIVCPIIAGSMDIHWDGSAATCLEAGGGLQPEWAGNIFKTSISDVAASSIFMRQVLQARRPQSACVSCDEYRNCKSGCGVLFRYWDPNLDQDCPGFKRFIKFVRSVHEAGLKPRYTEYVGKGCR